MATAVSGATAAATTSAAATKVSEDFTMFLKLLTTQMQNQDPLKPMDSTAYTQQLAQFSQVEQTVKQSQKLDDILSALTTQGMAQASGFIGRSAEFDTPVSGLSAETPARWRVSPPAGTTSLTATVTDASGRTVATEVLDPAATAFAWNGALTGGGTAPAGSYTLKLAALDASGATLTAGIAATGRVDQVSSTGGAVTLGVNGVEQPLARLVKLAAE